MRQGILVVGVMGVALMLAVGLAMGAGVEGVGTGKARAQEASGADSAGGRAEARGVATRPEQAGSQDAPVGPRRDVPAPPVGMTERGKAALKQARLGNARPSQAKEITAPVRGGSPSSQQPENAPEVPVQGTSFLGVSDSGWFPPDPQIAAGPNNIVAATNGAVNIRTKDGALLSSQTLGGFFSALGSEHSGAFDPWVTYDPYLNRFWIMAVSRDETTQRSDILIGLSNTQDATLGWRMWELNGSVNGSNATSNWCDYPKLGFDTQAIYVTCNMFAFGGGNQYSKIRIMAKNQFVNNTAIFWWDFWDVREGGSGTAKAFTIQPAVMYGATAASGGFLVNARGGGGTGSALDVWRVPNPLECCNGDAVGPTLNNQGRSVAGYGPSDGARQPGTTTQINNGDSRLLYAVWKNGRLSTGHTVACGGTNACGGFTELNVSAYPTITTLNDWVLTAGGEDVYFPAVSVNAADDKAMVYTVSDPNRFASAAWAAIPSSADCTNCVDGGTNILRSGQSTYVRTDTIGRNRWGDYSGASPDPNGQGIWVLGEFAASTANTWGAQVGLTYQAAPPPANDNFSRSEAIFGGDASVSGTTRFATREPSEPDHSTDTDGASWIGDHSAWYSWTAPNTGSVSMDTCSASIDSILAVYTGGSPGGLSRVTDNNNDFGACGTNNFGSRVAFNATAGTTYRIAVADAGGLRENSFVLKLLQQVPDTTKPRVTSVAPANGATGVGLSANVRAFFSEAMTPATISTTTFKLMRAGTTNVVGATVNYDPATKKATLNPNNNLRAATKYKAVITTGAKDLAGNNLDQKPSIGGNQKKAWTFTTRR